MADDPSKAGDPPPAPAPDPTPDPAAAAPQFTQADVDRLIAERLDAAAKAAEARAAKDRKAAADAALAEQGQWKTLAEQKEAERAAAAEGLTKAQAAVRTARLEHAVELAAHALDFADPDDALKLADLAAVTFDAAGKPEKASIEAALKALAKAKPHLLATTARVFSGSPSRRGTAPPPPPTRADRPLKSLVR